MTPFLAFDGCEVRVNTARSNLWVSEGERDIFAARCFGFSEPSSADFGVMQSSA